MGVVQGCAGLFVVVVVVVVVALWVVVNYSPCKARTRPSRYCTGTVSDHGPAGKDRPGWTAVQQ